MGKCQSLFLLMLLIASCSRVNTASREHYDQKKMRHGLVPLPTVPKKRKPTPPDPKALAKVDSRAVQRGKVVYKVNCWQCHGLSGRGGGPRSDEFTPPPKDLIQAIREVPNFKFYMMVSNWKGQMPGWKNALSKSELRDIEHYLRFLASQQ